MTGLKVAALTGVSQLSKMLATLAIIKMIAVQHGPEGLGYLGNFMSLTSIATVLAGGGIVTGVIKYVSEFAIDPCRLAGFLGSALVYTLGASLLFVVAGVFFLEDFSQAVFLEPNRGQVLLAFLACQVLIGFCNLSYGLVNGLQRTVAYSAIVLTGNVLAVAASFALVRRFGIPGAILALMTPIVLPFLPALGYVLKSGVMRNLRFDSFGNDFRLLSKYSLMILSSAVCFPLVEIVVRNHLVDVAGLPAAGFWQATTKLSSAYLSFFSLFLSFYLVPLVSPIQDKGRILAVVRNAAFMVVGLYAAMAAVFALFSTEVIELVLSAEFAGIRKLMFVQMAGDLVRVTGWVIGFVVVAKAAAKLYIASELFQGLGFALLSYLLLGNGGNEMDVVIAYCITNLLYFFIAVAGFAYYVRKRTAP